VEREIEVDGRGRPSLHRDLPGVGVDGRDARRYIDPSNYFRCRHGRPRPCKLGTVDGLSQSWPQPAILPGQAGQTGSNRIAKNVIDSLTDALFATDHPVERLFLPDTPSATQGFIDAMGRGAFNSLHDFGEAKRAVFVCEGSKNQMNVIRHDDQPVKIATFAIIVEAGVENDRAGGFGQNPAAVGNEGYEDRSVVALVVGELAAVFVFSQHAGIAITVSA